MKNPFNKRPDSESIAKYIASSLPSKSSEYSDI